MTSSTSLLADPSVAGQPFDYYEALRKDGPVHLDPQFGFYLVIGHAEVQRVLREHDLFSSRVIGLLGGSIALAVPLVFGALGGIVSGSGPTVAFLTESHEASLDLSVSLAASDLCRDLRRAKGPVHGAHVVATPRHLE